MNHTSLTKSGWIALGIGLTFPLVANFLYFVASPSPIVSRIGYGLSKAMLIAWPLIAIFWLLPKNVPGARLADPPKRLWSVGIGILLGALIFGAIALLMNTPIGAMVMDGRDVVQGRMDKMGFSKNFLLSALMISLVHSALEEYYWRWFAWRQVERFFPSWKSHVIAGFAFAAHHYVIVWAFFTPWLAIVLGTLVAVGGILWSQLYQRTGSLLGPWVSHIIVDLGIFWVAWQMIQS